MTTRVGPPKPAEIVANPNLHAAWIATFRAALFDNGADYQAMYWLGLAWHFFDARLDTEEARIQRQCFVELLIYSGVWLPDQCESVFTSLVGAQGRTRRERFIDWLRSLSGLALPKKKEENESTQRT